LQVLHYGHVHLALDSIQTNKWAGLSAHNHNKTLKQRAESRNQQVVSEMWTRPVLCRFCECPVSDGGVRVDQLDAAKLFEWWLRKIGTDFQPEKSQKLRK
jgi:hypothetical protein